MNKKLTAYEVYEKCQGGGRERLFLMFSKKCRYCNGTGEISIPDII